MSGRVIAGVVMGGLTLALIGRAQAIEPSVAGSLIRWVLPVAVLVILLITVLSATSRTALGRLCLLNGMMSSALAGVTLLGEGQPIWPSDPGYEHSLDRALQWWLAHLMWTAAAYFGTAIVLTAGLFALSYWLLRSHPGRGHGAR